ncbi:plasmodesmata-located protein 6-like [Rhodamnia argentea]|uniref:Plasmodesmata-located protein 6-like n=1 Tax=Rhodamnia argentea TaxID=178133 RepID=A0ABM3HK78_9MYRT|nr:plasmodesmata-located protein 6-like [Rhodamnia argentea]
MSLSMLSLLLLLLLLPFSFLVSLSTSSFDSFIYVRCSQYKYSPGSPFETGVDSVLTSLVSSSASSSYNNFTIPGSTPSDTVYGLYQCRGDLTVADCSSCVSHAVSQLGTTCAGSSGSTFQLEGCLVRYDNTTFLGAQDKTVMLRRCGPLTGDANSDELTRRDAVLGYVGAGDGTYKPYRTGSSGSVQAVAQCVQDLSNGDCQDCLAEAIGQLKSDCGAAKWGDMYLAKCYVQYSDGNHTSGGQGTTDEEVEKTVVILIGLVAGVAVVIILLALTATMCERARGGKERWSKDCCFSYSIHVVGLQLFIKAPIIIHVYPLF